MTVLHREPFLMKDDEFGNLLLRVLDGWLEYDSWYHNLPRMVFGLPDHRPIFKFYPYAVYPREY